MRAFEKDWATLALVTSLCQEQKPPKNMLLNESWHLSGLKRHHCRVGSLEAPGSLDAM